MTPFSGADGDGSGVIDAGELGPWRLRFGHAVNAASTTLAQLTVPESAGLTLAVAAAFAINFRSHRRANAIAA